MNLASSRLGLKAAAFCWAALVAFITFSAVKTPHTYDSSLLALLPSSEQHVLVERVTEQMERSNANKLLLIVTAKEDEKARSAVKELANYLLSGKTKDEILDITWFVEEGEINTIYQEQFAYRFVILNKQIRSLLILEDNKKIIDQALARLYSPVPLVGNALIDDPFSLFSETNLKQVSGLNIQIKNSLFKIKSSKDPSYLLSVTLKGDVYSPTFQEKIMSKMDTQKAILAEKGIQLTLSGMILHTAAGTRQAKNEILTIGVGSLIGIVLLVLYVFHQFKPLLLILLAVSVGLTMATAASLLIFQHVHLITLAFGAALVGVSIDYALHFLCLRQVTPRRRFLRKILPGLSLALFSSSLAYAFQAFTPFPGLRQMAVYSIIGLASSWMTVVLWFPLLTKNLSQKPLGLANKLSQLRNNFPLLKNNISLIMLLMSLAGVTVFSLLNSKNIDDIRLLQTSPVSLLEQEKKIRKLLSVNNSTQFLLISSTTLEQCLQIEEELIEKLEDLKQKHPQLGYRSLSSTLPSIKRQQADLELVDQLYKKELSEFYKRLNLNDTDQNNAQKSFDHAKELLSFESWKRLAVSEGQKQLIITQTDDQTMTMVQLNGEISHELNLAIKMLSESDKAIIYVDRIQALSDIFTEYRQQIVAWVLMAYMIVLLILVTRYKRQAWRILLPPFLASFYTLAALIQIEGGVNLFHILALILVLGIGLDLGIFLTETDDSCHAWLAGSLSIMTSILAFGLLALSHTPVLHHFGLAVLIGLSLVWLLAPLVRKEHCKEMTI